MEVLRQYFPDDLAKLICHKKYKSEHYDALEECHDQIEVRTLLQKYKDVQEEMEEQGYVVEEQDERLKKTFPHLQALLNTLKKCKCCNIHSMYKPMSATFMDACEYRICCSPPREKVMKSCTCACRHMARRMTRVHTYTELEYIEDDRHILHMDYLQTYEHLKEAKIEIEENMNQRKIMLEELSTTETKTDSTSQDTINCKYSEYYEKIDQIIRLQHDYDIYKQQHEENIFVLKNHIMDHTNVYTQADAFFLKIHP